MRWVHVRASGTEELATLRRHFLLREEDLRDVPPPTQRPKIVFRDNYVFFILLFPYFDRERHEILISEVDFFIGPNFLITVNSGDHVPMLKDRLTRCKKNTAQARDFCSGNAGVMALTILEELLSSQFPMLIHVGEDIDEAESKLFDHAIRNSDATISSILRIKNNVTSFRRAAMGHKSVIERLSGDALPSDVHIDQPTVRRLVDISKEVWNLLENHRETISTLHDTHASLLTVRTNEIMRTLTMFSVIVFPLNLFAAIFSMNTDTMPIVGHPFGFWIIVGLMTAGVIGMIAFFREKRWL